MSLKSKNSSGQGSRAAQINGYRIGQVVDGVIKKIETYGVFIEVSGTRVSGLCHKSEVLEIMVIHVRILTNRVIAKVSDRKDMDSASLLKAFSEGDVVKAKVLAIDADKGRISFGLKPSYFQRGDMEVDGPDELEKDDDGER
jgi:rRNA biogenesis protein RRP5